MDRDGNLVMEDSGLWGFREFWEGMVYGGFVDDWGWDGAELCEEAEYWAIFLCFQL